MVTTKAPPPRAKNTADDDFTNDLIHQINKSEGGKIAFNLAADNSKDAAIVLTLPPGGYTVVTSGVANTTGTALVEVYDLDP